MAGEIVAFLGPTLPRAEASAILQARVLPPAEQGSFVRAVREHSPKAIVLIDGVFGKTPAVRHKEIFWTLAQGIPVFGAASVGALRAAELSSVGMRGLGFIYRWYSLTPLADDDEVAVAMTPPELGAEPLSEALINIRLTLRRAVRCAILPGDVACALQKIARAMHFVDRSYQGLIEQARLTLPAHWQGALDDFADWVPANATDQKRADAVGLLTRLAADPSLLEIRPNPSPPFRMTEAWAYDLDAAGLWSDELSTG